MRKVILQLYRFLPKNIVKRLGKSKWLKPLRDATLRDKSGAKTITVSVNRAYPPYKVAFEYHAALKDAAKAQKRGVENTLLRHTIEILHSKGVTEKAVVLDVGANYGYLSMVWCQTLAANGGRVYSFEPGRKVFEAFMKTIKLNRLQNHQITLENVAVGSQSGIVQLHDFGTTSNTLIDRKVHDDSYSVPMVSIDDYMVSAGISIVDLIKIDVDGIEYEILQGARDTLMTHKPVLVIETNDDKRIIDYCKELGYHVLDMKLEEYQNTDKIPGNIFCV